MFYLYGKIHLKKCHVPVTPNQFGTLKGLCLGVAVAHFVACFSKVVKSVLGPLAQRVNIVSSFQIGNSWGLRIINLFNIA